jgi:hypothetical protein
VKSTEDWHASCIIHAGVCGVRITLRVHEQTSVVFVELDSRVAMCLETKVDLEVDDGWKDKIIDGGSVFLSLISYPTLS